MIRLTRERFLEITGWAVAIGWFFTFYWFNQVDVPLGQGLHSNDFKHIWIGARLLHLGESPYDEDLMFAMANAHGLGGINPYVYLPFTGLAMWPVARLEFAEAARLWFRLSHLLLLAALLGSAVHTTRGRLWWMSGWIAALGLIVASQMMPLTRQLTAGQLNCALALALVVILIAVERRWDWLAGLAIAFATLFKMSPGLFILYLLWKRAWRPLAWTTAGLVVLGGWSLWQVGLRVHLDFLPLLADMRIGHSTWAHHGMAYHVEPANQAMGAFLLHALAGEGGMRPWLDLGPGVANALTALFSLAVLGTLIFATRRGWGAEGPAPEVWRAEWSLVVIASLLIPSLMWDHYAVQLLPVLLVAVWGTATLPDRSPWTRAALVVLWTATAWLLSVPVDHWSPDLRGGLGLVVISVRLWGTLLMFGLVLWWRRRLDGAAPRGGQGAGSASSSSTEAMTSSRSVGE